MAIRLLDRPATRGRIDSALDGVNALAEGLHLAPEGRSGILMPQLDGVAAQIEGAHSEAPDRTGVFGTALEGVSSLFTGSFASSSSSILFRDRFQTGGKSAPQNDVSWIGGGPPVVPLARSPTGYALRFRFGPDPDGDDSTSEQRFSLGAPGQAGAYTDFWCKMVVLWPANYVHRSQSHLPSGQRPTNNKFFRIWNGDDSAGNDYRDYYIKGGFSTNDSGGYSSILSEWGRGQGPAGTNDGVGTAGTGSTAGWVTAADLDQIVEYVLHVRTDTIGAFGTSLNYPANTGNAALQAWKNGVKLVDHTDLNWAVDPATVGVANKRFEFGYLFGWSNSGFLEVTDIHLLDVIFATTNQFGVN